ncbi:hypothetical protein THTE_3254 [Thermogutta terrifontis]|uniref:Uncharacterized protein n=1 Tax=Thermogutta terrifontis TaxID=1331910 RepID=A0A286RIU1_9BACT|nr:hypothetical protein THTE_3254 [Thermogutta terrifontis]
MPVIREEIDAFAAADAVTTGCSSTEQVASYGRGHTLSIVMTGCLR